MKKLLTIGACALVFSSGAFTATPALADNHGGGKGQKFEKHDTNGDGVISKDEFLSHAETKFDEMDANNDGSVSKDEGKAHREARRAKMKENIEQRRENRQNNAE